FLGIDWVLKKIERFRLTPFRRWAVRRAVRWVRERTDPATSDGLGAIFPPIVYHAIVLKCLGVPADDPEMLGVLKQLDDLAIEEDGTLRLQPCKSPVWDTAISLIGVADAGQAAESEEVETAVRWLLDREVRCLGDWAKTLRGVEPGGWFFEYKNAHYPDVD